MEPPGRGAISCSTHLTPILRPLRSQRVKVSEPRDESQPGLGEETPLPAPRLPAARALVPATCATPALLTRTDPRGRLLPGLQMLNTLTWCPDVPCPPTRAQPKRPPEGLRGWDHPHDRFSVWFQPTDFSLHRCLIIFVVRLGTNIPF